MGAFEAIPLQLNNNNSDCSESRCFEKRNLQKFRIKGHGYQKKIDGNIFIAEKQEKK